MLFRSPADAPRDGPKPDRKKGPKSQKSTSGVLWVRDTANANRVRPLKVKVGISDGAVTEVSPASADVTLAEGTQVVVGELHEASDASSGETTNPFAPKFPPRGRR